MSTAECKGLDAHVSSFHVDTWNCQLVVCFVFGSLFVGDSLAAFCKSLHVLFTYKKNRQGFAQSGETQKKM